MNAEQFIKLYSNFYGEKVDNLEQICVHNFSGHELFEFAKYVRESELIVAIEQLSLKDLEIRQNAVSVPKITQNNVNDKQLVLLQRLLDDEDIFWFEIGVDDMGYLVIANDGKANYFNHKKQILKAINQIIM